MSAHIIQLADVRARRAEARINEALELAHRFHFWTGASGRRYVHTIYSLIECPALPAGNYVLVRRDDDGRRTVLSIGRVSHTASSLNLAEIRQRGAQLGANEVHVHLLAETAHERRLVEFDLRSSQGSAAVAEPMSQTRH